MLNIPDTMNLDELIITEKQFNDSSINNISEDEINDLCQTLLENDELLHEFDMTNKWLGLPTKNND